MGTFELIKEAEKRIAPHIVSTPYLRAKSLDAALGCEAYIKAECMQTTGAFKLRGAMNKALSLTRAELDKGLVCASSGNHGRAVAYAARMLGTNATVVVPNNAAPVKVEAIKALGAEVVQCETSVRFKVAEELCARKNATLIPPYNDEQVIAGQGTLGLEIAEQAPELDAVVVPVSGGGLIAGTSCAVKTLRPDVKVYGAEPAPLPRYSTSLKEGKATTVPQLPTAADALVSQTPGAICFPIVRQYVDAVVPVSDECLLKALGLVLTEAKIFAEPSACIGVGAVLQGALKFEPTQKVCFVVSGGNASIAQINALLG